MDRVWVLLWWDDGDFFRAPELQVFGDHESAKQALREIVEEVMQFNDLDLEDELEYYIPGSVVEHGGDHAEIVEKEVV